MQTPIRATVLAAAFSLLALPTAPADAVPGAGVMRCKLPDGSTLYTNRACASQGGVAIPLPAEVLNRIASERRFEARTAAEAEGLDPAEALAALDADALVPQAVGPRRPVANGCAASPAQLAVDLKASVRDGDVNRIAESFAWAGMDNAHAQQVMDQLKRMGGQAVRDAEYFDATIGSHGDAGLMQVTFEDSGRAAVDDFAVVRNGGCYFLRYA